MTNNIIKQYIISMKYKHNNKSVSFSDAALVKLFWLECGGDIKSVDSQFINDSFIFRADENTLILFTLTFPFENIDIRVSKLTYTLPNKKK
jgi:hypothetical protein